MHGLAWGRCTFGYRRFRRLIMTFLSPHIPRQSASPLFPPTYVSCRRNHLRPRIVVYRYAFNGHLPTALNESLILLRYISALTALR